MKKIFLILIFILSIQLRVSAQTSTDTSNIKKKFPVYMGLSFTGHYAQCCKFAGSSVFISWKRTTLYGGPILFESCEDLFTGLEEDKYIKWGGGGDVGYNIGYQYNYFERKDVLLFADLNVAAFPVNRIGLQFPGYYGTQTASAKKNI